MKPRLPATLLLLAVAGIVSAAPPVATPAALVQAVLEANDTLTAAANRLDAEAFFALIAESDESRIIQDGRLFTTRAEAIAAFRQGSQGVAKIERRFNDPHVTVLASDVALLTAAGSTALTLQDGRSFESPFAVSLVFVLRDGRWILLHGHFSVPNPAP